MIDTDRDVSKFPSHGASSVYDKQKSVPKC